MTTFERAPTTVFSGKLGAVSPRRVPAAGEVARRDPELSEAARGALRGALLLTLSLLSGCAGPRGLPNTMDPGRSPSGVRYPDLLAPGGIATNGRDDAAIIIAIENYRNLGKRVGAHAVAAAWYRYFRGLRGMKARRVALLRDDEVTPRRIARAIERARFNIHRQGTLWFVFIGHISSESSDSFGDMWLQDGDGTPATTETHSFPITQVLDRAAYGTHPRAVAVLDGCLNGRGGSRISGTPTPPTPPFRYTGRVDDAWFMKNSPKGKNTAWSALSDLERVLVDSARSRREPSDVSIYSAGAGARCLENLPGTQFPALSYLLLGGLRGWADQDRDGVVSSVEVIKQVTMMLRAAASGLSAVDPQPSLYGADIPLALGAAEAGPTLAQLIPPGQPPETEAQLRAEPVLWAADRSIRFDRGDFHMGCPRRRDPTCERDEHPAYRVDLSRFFLDPMEVTQAEYQSCVDAGICSPIDPRGCFVWTGTGFERGGVMPAQMQGPTLPAVCVTWFQARLFCAVAGKRLPTEAEWERAAAGTTRRRYPWGDAPPTCGRAHFDGCGDHTRPVGGRPLGATPEGVHDLAGNVAEWVHDWYAEDTYWRPFRSDPTGPDRGIVRAVRGGSFYDSPSLLRASYRYGLNPGSAFSTVGFRCAR